MPADWLPLLRWPSPPLCPLYPQTSRRSQGAPGRISEEVQPVLRSGRMPAAGAAPVLSFPGAQGVLAGCNFSGSDLASKAAILVHFLPHAKEKCITQTCRSSIPGRTDRLPPLMPPWSRSPVRLFVVTHVGAGGGPQMVRQMSADSVANRAAFLDILLGV